jgi:Lon protease-like protein
MNSEIALFPIPNCVSFPKTVIPLHIFEPRYRQLFKESIPKRRMVAVCHVVRQLSESKTFKTQAEALHSNQASFEPVKIFGAGPAEILEVTADGRLMVQIAIQSRFQFVDEIQSVPYRVAVCRELPDFQEPEVESPIAKNMMQEILQSLSRLTDKELAPVLQPELWKAVSVGDFTNQIFQFLRLEPEIMQSLLEERSPSNRLKALAQVLCK